MWINIYITSVLLYNCLLKLDTFLKYEFNFNLGDFFENGSNVIFSFNFIILKFL